MRLPRRISRYQTGGNTMLEECCYRVELKTPNRFFCRHLQIRSQNSIVTAQICSDCTKRTTPCETPRPVPPDPDSLISGEPTFFQMVWNVSSSLAAFVSDGAKLVDEETYASRLEVCDSCDHRSGNRCGSCGCLLSLKAAGRAFDCPLGKWTELANTRKPYSPDSPAER